MTLCKCQFQRLHPTPLCSVRLRRHVLMPGHQIARPVTASAEQSECANAVHGPARRSREQIVVQIHQFRDQPESGRDRTAKIVAAARIEEPFLDLIALAQPDVYRLIEDCAPG